MNKKKYLYVLSYFNFSIMILNDWYQVIVSTESFANLIKCAILSWNKVRTIIYETMKIKWKNLKHTVTNNEKNKET